MYLGREKVTKAEGFECVGEDERPEEETAREEEDIGHGLGVVVALADERPVQVATVLFRHVGPVVHVGVHGDVLDLAHARRVRHRVFVFDEVLAQFHVTVWWRWKWNREFKLMTYSLNKKEWICSLFKEWILEKSEIRVIWSEHLCYSLILEWPQGSLGIPEWSLWSLQNEWITQMFTPNSL